MQQYKAYSQCKKEERAREMKEEKKLTATRVNYGKWQIVQTQHTAQHNICMSNLLFFCVATASIATVIVPIRPLVRVHSPISTPVCQVFYFNAQLQKRNSITNEICLLAI